MVEIKDIEDRESLEAWLKALPSETEEDRAAARRVAVTLAFRAAARVLPVWWDHTLHSQHARKRDVTALPILRSLLISSVAALVPTEEIRKAATAARAAAATTAAATTTDAARAAAAAAARAATTYAATAARAADATADAARAATTYAATAAATTWENIRIDAGALWQAFHDETKSKQVFSLPLWQGDPPNEDLWIKTQNTLREADQAENWAFWIDWYNRLLSGTALVPDHPMMIEIAKLSDDVWEDEAEALKQIKEIWETSRVRGIIEANPLGQRLERNQQSGKLVSHPFEERDLSDLVDELRKNLLQFLANSKKSGGNFGAVIVGAFEPHIKELRDLVSKHKTNPKELLNAVEQSQRAFAILAQDNGATRDIYVDRLMHQMGNVANGICAAAPELMEEIKARRAVEFQRIGLQRVQLALRMSAGMAADCEGGLRDAVAYATLCIASPDCSDDEKAAAWTFLSGAIPRGAKLVHDAGEEGADGSKDPTVLETVVSYADSANKLDKGVDAVQEAIAEGGPWATEAFTQMVSGNFWGFSFF